MDKLLPLMIGVAIFLLGFNTGLYFNKERAIINEEYQECISDLPRNQDCKLTGFIFTVTNK